MTGMTVKIVPNDKGNPPGKLADAELHFVFFPGSATEWEKVPAGMPTEAYLMAEALNGLRLIGFSVWERRGGSGRNVVFPARQYSVNGERRSFALLRPITDAAGQERIRELVLQAYAAYEAAAAETV